MSLVPSSYQEPWPKPDTAIGAVSFQCITGIFWAWLAASASLELPTSVGSLLDRWAVTCCALPPLHLPTYGMVQRKRVETQQASMKRAESHSWSCLASQPKLWLLFHLQFLLAYAFVVQYSIQIKVRYLTFWSAQYLYMKLLICFYDQAVILSIQ